MIWVEGGGARCLRGTAPHPFADGPHAAAMAQRDRGRGGRGPRPAGPGPFGHPYPGSRPGGGGALRFTVLLKSNHSRSGNSSSAEKLLLFLITFFCKQTLQVSSAYRIHPLEIPTATVRIYPESRAIGTPQSSSSPIPHLTLDFSKIAFSLVFFAEPTILACAAESPGSGGNGVGAHASPACAPGGPPLVPTNNQSRVSFVLQHTKIGGRSDFPLEVI